MLMRGWGCGGRGVLGGGERGGEGPRGGAVYILI